MLKTRLENKRVTLSSKGHHTSFSKNELRRGIEVVGENELNSKLEDYI